MDKARAKRITRELTGKSVSGWKIIDKINFGKSSLVLKGQRGKEIGAVKIFDPDLVERFGRANQLTRIEREKSLIDHTHPNLIKILDGGDCKETSYLFIVMEYLPHKNLAQKLKQIPRNLIPQIVQQVASAAQFLEERGFVHRDIKPENILISDDFTHVTLLDLGVLRPIGLSTLTDHDEQRAFLGTLQYSPPELLFRDEEDTIEGWRAITFYQLGAVLHDLIMKRPIFGEHCDPFARMVDAVHNTVPEIRANDVDINLQWLVKCCLLKDPKDRLSFVQWQSFLTLSMSNTISEPPKDVLIRKQNILKSQQLDKQATQLQKDEEVILGNYIQRVSEDIQSIIRNICTSNTECLPRFQINTASVNKSGQILVILYLEPSLKHALMSGIKLCIRISVENIQEGIVRLEYVAFYQAQDMIFNEENLTHVVTIFRGPYQKEVIREKVKSVLFFIVDQSLDTEAATGEKADAVTKIPCQVRLKPFIN